MTYVHVTLLKVCFAHLVQQDTESACTMINIYTLAQSFQKVKLQNSTRIKPIFLFCQHRLTRSAEANPSSEIDDIVLWIFLLPFLSLLDQQRACLGKEYLTLPKNKLIFWFLSLVQSIINVRISRFQCSVKGSSLTRLSLSLHWPEIWRRQPVTLLLLLLFLLFLW